VSTRAEVMAALKVDDSFIRGSILNSVLEGVDEPCASAQLLATASLDREWIRTAKHAKKHGISDIRQLGLESLTVKNTFVDLSPGRAHDDVDDDRPYSSDSETFRSERPAFFEEEEQHEPAKQKKTRRSARKCGWTRQRRRVAQQKAAEDAEIPLEERSTAEDTDTLAS